MTKIVVKNVLISGNFLSAHRLPRELDYGKLEVIIPVRSYWALCDRTCLHAPHVVDCLDQAVVNPNKHACDIVELEATE